MFVEDWTGALQVLARSQTVQLSWQFYFRNALSIVTKVRPVQWFKQRNWFHWTSSHVRLIPYRYSSLVNSLLSAKLNTSLMGLVFLHRCLGLFDIIPLPLSPPPPPPPALTVCLMPSWISSYCRLQLLDTSVNDSIICSVHWVRKLCVLITFPDN